MPKFYCSSMPLANRIGMTYSRGVDCAAIAGDDHHDSGPVHMMQRGRDSALTFTAASWLSYLTALFYTHPTPL